MEKMKMSYICTLLQNVVYHEFITQKKPQTLEKLQFLQLDSLILLPDLVQDLEFAL